MTGRRRWRCSDLGSTFTLYGGSVFTRSITAPARSAVDVGCGGRVAAHQPVRRRD